MIILRGISIGWKDTSVKVELPGKNMILDPRPNRPRDVNYCFECIYHANGTTVTLNRKDERWYGCNFEFRVYDPAKEPVPNFHLTTYIYLGVDGEGAPYETTELIIDPSVRIIKVGAFSGCRRIHRCLMGDGVHTIEKHAFAYCAAMKVLRLSRTLVKIESRAFNGCTALEALFLPANLEVIENEAFFACKNLRILPLLPSHQQQQHQHQPTWLQLGEAIMYGCDAFFSTTQIQPYRYRKSSRSYNSEEVHQSMIHFYNNLPSLHKVCLCPDVTAQTIHQCLEEMQLNDLHANTIPLAIAASAVDHDGMTPLHILSMNPHVHVSHNVGTIMACFQVNMAAAFVRDRRNKNALDYLMEYGNLEGHTLLVAALCLHRISHRGVNSNRSYSKVC